MLRGGIRRRLYLSFGTLLALLFILAAVALAQAGIMRSATGSLTNHAIPLRDAVLSVVRDMLNEETGVRGYIITYDDSYLQPYRSGHDAVATDMARLQAIAANDPS